MIRSAAILLVIHALLVAGCATTPAPSDHIDLEPQPQPPAETAFAMEGIWLGTLSAGVELRLVLTVQPDGDGWQATLDSIDQGAYGMAVDTLSVDGDAVSFTMRAIGASYTGSLVDDDHINGTWNQGLPLPLAFERTDGVPVVNRPQTPHAPFPYTSEDVAYSFDPRDPAPTFAPSASDDDSTRITLCGTLTLPPGDGPHPAVLLITGSGPQDRDETLMQHKPFWVLADHLSRHGLAVLRVDDRGVGESTGDFHSATSADFATDAAVGFHYLQQRADIDPTRVALLGHSEGGLIAPMVAADNPEVAAIVLMAGPGVDGQRILELQQRLLLEAQGVPPSGIAVQQERQAALIDIVGADMDPSELSARLDAHCERTYDDLSLAERQAAGSLEEYKSTIRRQVGTPWMRWFLRHDPAPVLSRVACPVLAVNGGKDLQVDPEQNIPAIAAALAAGGNGDVTTVVLPGLNHLFQHCETGGIGEYGLIEETLAPEFLAVVEEWLGKWLKGPG